MSWVLCQEKNGCSIPKKKKPFLVQGKGTRMFGSVVKIY